MSHSEDNPVTCTDPSCAAQHPSGKWGNIRATSEGWYHARDNTAYCPKHVPKWVKTWRTR